MIIEKTNYYIKPVQMKSFTRQHKQEECSKPVYIKSIKRVYTQETSAPSYSPYGMVFSGTSNFDTFA